MAEYCPPILWLVVFNTVIEKLKAVREQNSQALRVIECRDFIFADDITMVISAPTVGELRTAAAVNVQCLQQVLVSG